MTPKIFVAPLRYVQGPDALMLLGGQLQSLGIKSPLILASPSARKAAEGKIKAGLDRAAIKGAFLQFGGECTFGEIERVKNVCIEGDHDAVVSCGGGKTLDTGRCAASGAATNVQKVPPEFFSKLGADVPCVNIPTVAATDASTSAASLVHTEEGKLEATIVFPTNPTMVLVDTEVIAKSPVRLLVAGMGDALATYFEADMCYRTSTPALGTAGLSTRTGQALARLCFDILIDYGVQAKVEGEAGVAGPAIEAITEANVLLSGLGFESCGLSAAHAVGNAFEHVPEAFAHPQYHGERVAFGTLTQLMLEGRGTESLDDIFAFCRNVGLPTTFRELSLESVSDEVLNRVADVASRDILIRSMPEAREHPDENGRFYDDKAILRAMKSADAYGRGFKIRP